MITRNTLACPSTLCATHHVGAAGSVRSPTSIIIALIMPTQTGSYPHFTITGKNSGASIGTMPEFSSRNPATVKIRMTMYRATGGASAVVRAQSAGCAGHG